MEEQPQDGWFNRSWLMGLVFAAVIISGLLFTWYRTWQDRPPEGVIVANGRIEGRETTISSEISEQIKQLHAEESDRVSAGDLLVELDRDRLSAQRQTARSKIKEMQAMLKSAREDLSFTKEHVNTNINAARSALASTRAKLEEAKSRLEFAAVEYERAKDTYEKDATPGTDRDRKRMQFKTAKAKVKSARKQLEKAKAQLNAAKAEKKRIKVKQEHVNQVKAQLSTARSRLREIEVRLEDTRIHSPLDGTVLTRAVEEGETVQPGTPLYSILNLNKLYMKVYVPEPKVGQLNPGQKARVYVDAYPDQPFDATVSKIYQEAEFTPKDVQTREERVKQVFGVELSIDNPERTLHPGMPGDAVIRLNDTAPWHNPF